jgi:hypothetical protein
MKDMKEKADDSFYSGGDHLRMNTGLKTDFQQIGALSTTRNTSP